MKNQSHERWRKLSEAPKNAMKAADQHSKTLFLNGKEVASFEPTGDEAQDLAAAKKLLAEESVAATSRVDPVVDNTEPTLTSLYHSAS